MNWTELKPEKGGKVAQYFCNEQSLFQDIGLNIEVSFPKNNSNAYRGYTGDKVKGKVAQSCLTFCDSMDYTYTVHGILPGQNTGVCGCSLLQGIIQTQVSHTAGKFFTSWATREAQKETNRDTDMWTGLHRTRARWLHLEQTVQQPAAKPQLTAFCELKLPLPVFPMLQERSKFQMILWNLPAFKYWKLFFKVLKHCSEQI